MATTFHTSLAFSFAAGNADMQLSFGSIGDAFDNRQRHQAGLGHPR